MASQRKRHLFLGLGLTVALVLAVGLLPAVASAASTLTGESFNGSSSSGNSGACPTPTFAVSGTATGPYPGTFTESGSWTVLQFEFNATFTTASGTTTITGSKTLGLASSQRCSDTSGASENTTGAPYTATIHTPSGNFHDEGTSDVHITITAAGAATLTENFTSSLAQPVRLAPTNKDQCKNGGWQGFFTNQGQCASSFQSQSQT